MPVNSSLSCLYFLLPSNSLKSTALSNLVLTQKEPCLHTAIPSHIPIIHFFLFRTFREVTLVCACPVSSASICSVTNQSENISLVAAITCVLFGRSKWGYPMGESCAERAYPNAHLLPRLRQNPDHHRAARSLLEGSARYLVPLLSGLLEIVRSSTPVNSSFVLPN